MIMGIAIGVVAVGLIVALVCFYLIKTKKLGEYYYMITDSAHTDFNICL